jgi:hypothetical protein
MKMVEKILNITNHQRKCKSKTQKYHLTPAKMTTIKMTITINHQDLFIICGEKLEFLYTNGRNVN